MADDLRLQTLRQQFRLRARLDVTGGILGDSSGKLYVDGKPGFVWVRPGRPGNLLPAIPVKREGVVYMRAGICVKLGYNEAGEQVVLGPDIDAQVAAGQNPNLNNPADRNVYGMMSQSSIAQAFSGPSSPPGTVVNVAGLLWHNGSQVLYMPGSQVDVGAYIPGTQQHRVLGVYLGLDNTLKLSASTAKSTSDPIGVADMQEAYTAVTKGNRPVWYYRLHDAQTTVLDPDKLADAREFLSAPMGYVLTSDANVSATPAASELYAAFGTQNDGFLGVLDDGGAGATVYVVVRKNSAWWYASMTEAT